MIYGILFELSIMKVCSVYYWESHCNIRENGEVKIVCNQSCIFAQILTKKFASVDKAIVLSGKYTLCN